MAQIITYPSLEPFPKMHGVLVGGCFDIFHYGHLNFLKSAKTHGNTLIVALESDESIIIHKKTPPIHTQRQRAELLAELLCVDYIILLPHLTSFDDYLTLVQWVCPKVIAVTEGDPQLAHKEQQAQAVGGKVHVVNHLIKGLSSRLIRSTATPDDLLKVF